MHKYTSKYFDSSPRHNFSNIRDYQSFDHRQNHNYELENLRFSIHNPEESDCKHKQKIKFSQRILSAKVLAPVMRWLNFLFLI